MSERKKIAVFITSTGWGGLEMNTIKLSKLLMGRDYDITLFSVEKSTLYLQAGQEFNQVELIKKRRKYFDVRTARDVAKRLKNNGIGLVFVVDNKDLDVLSWTKRLFFPELKIVYQQHMQIGINKKDLLHTIRFKSIDCWISPLPFLKLEVGLRTHFPLTKVEVVPIGIDIEQFSNPKYSKIEARKLLCIETNNQPLLGIIGRISQKKGQLFVVQSIIELRKTGNPVNLVIFGSATVNDEKDKKYAEELKQFVVKNDLSDVVHFVDYQKDVWKFYNSIDVFVLASHRETYGMVTIEAMLSSIPILATNSGGTPEILQNGSLGYLYIYESIESFCKAYLDLSENKLECMRKVVDAKQVAEETYNQDCEVNSISEIINRQLD